MSTSFADQAVMGQNKMGASFFMDSDMKQSYPGAFQLYVTPELAEKWLTQHHVHNRTISRASVDQYARDMLTGRWFLNGEAIIFDYDGKLRNGYHRLPACIKANVGFETFIVVGVSPESAIAMDGGRVRSFGDVLGMEGVDHSSKLASLARFCYNYEHRLERVATKLSSPTLNQWIASNPHAEAAIKWVNINKDIPVSPTVVMGLYYEALKAGWENEKLDEFFTKLKTGINLTENDPVTTLRKWLIRNNTKHARPSQLIYQVMVTKTLNAYLKGQKLALLRWQREGKAREEIPRIIKNKASVSSDTVSLDELVN